MGVLCGRLPSTQPVKGRKRLDRDEAARVGNSGETSAEQGQATVEFALVLVALVSVVWALLSLCLLVRDQVLVTHASREAARTYAVTRSLDAATQAARDRSGLGSDLVVTVEPQPDNLARITVALPVASRIPIAGRVRPNLQLQSSLITYVEPG
jgi:hypothetical protein